MPRINPNCTELPKKLKVAQNGQHLSRISYCCKFLKPSFLWDNLYKILIDIIAIFMIMIIFFEINPIPLPTSAFLSFFGRLAAFLIRCHHHHLLHHHHHLHHHPNYQDLSIIFKIILIITRHLPFYPYYPYSGHWRPPGKRILLSFCHVNIPFIIIDMTVMITMTQPDPAGLADSQPFQPSRTAKPSSKRCSESES